VQDVQTLVVAAQEDSREAHAAGKVRRRPDEIEQALRPKRD